MAHIFLSHSSTDEREVIALKQWLLENGWDDVFLDIDPQRGLVAGERWQEALRKAADRCAAVVFLVSQAWTKSRWCLAEFLLAKSLNKHIFGVVIKDVPLVELPGEMTSEWQLCRLTGSGATKTITFSYHESADRLDFLSDGLARLKIGLQKAGLTADFFPWPPANDPKRSPYRGLEPLDTDDAAVYFGRDLEILRALDVLRGMRASEDKKLFVILGPSGSGKSSFLRAGLLSRLRRDDRHFYPLPVIRPERDPISGEFGLTRSLSKSFADIGMPPINPGDIRNRLETDPVVLVDLLRQLLAGIQKRFVGITADNIKPPTLLLPIDQAEELFNTYSANESTTAIVVSRNTLNSDTGPEARLFLQRIGEALNYTDAKFSLIVAFTIRSDRYEPLQIAPELQGLKTETFVDLKPMPADRFREIILGPAKRASVAGSKMEIKTDLVDQLVEDCKEGGDTLPLLALTLSQCC
jgi:hypothetical protein